MSRTISRAHATKDCPFCAEPIRIAAIACRFCNRDLPAAGEAAVGVPAEVEVDLAEQPTPATTDDRSAPEHTLKHARTTARRWSVLLIATVAILAVVGVLEYHDWRAATQAQQATAAGKTVRATAPDLVEALLSYRHDQFDEDLAAAEKSMTTEFREKYRGTVEPIRADAIEQRRTQTAEVLAVSVISQAPQRVELLLYVDSTSTSGKSEDSRIIQAVLRAVMVTDDDGSWRLDDLTVPTS